MKQFSSMLALSLVLATGTALAVDPAKPTTKPAATAQTMDHSKMDMQQGQMDHSKMAMSGKKPADHQQMANDEFAALDTDKNGSLSKAEIPSRHPLATRFGMLDANKDGSVSKAEFAQHHGM